MRVKILSVKASDTFTGSAAIRFACPEAGIEEGNPESVHIYNIEELKETISGRIRHMVRARERFPAELEMLKLFEGKEIDIEL